MRPVLLHVLALLFLVWPTSYFATCARTRYVSDKRDALSGKDRTAAERQCSDEEMATFRTTFHFPEGDVVGAPRDRSPLCNAPRGSGTDGHVLYLYPVVEADLNDAFSLDNPYTCHTLMQWTAQANVHSVCVVRVDSPGDALQAVSLYPERSIVHLDLAGHGNGTALAWGPGEGGSLSVNDAESESFAKAAGVRLRLGATVFVSSCFAGTSHQVENIAEWVSRKLLTLRLPTDVGSIRGIRLFAPLYAFTDADTVVEVKNDKFFVAIQHGTCAYEAHTPRRAASDEFEAGEWVRAYKACDVIGDPVGEASVGAVARKSKSDQNFLLVVWDTGTVGTVEKSLVVDRISPGGPCRIIDEDDSNNPVKRAATLKKIVMIADDDGKKKPQAVVLLDEDVGANKSLLLGWLDFILPPASSDTAPIAGPRFPKVGDVVRVHSFSESIEGFGVIRRYTAKGAMVRFFASEADETEVQAHHFKVVIKPGMIMTISDASWTSIYEGEFTRVDDEGFLELALRQRLERAQTFTLHKAPDVVKVDMSSARILKAQDGERDIFRSTWEGCACMPSWEAVSESGPDYSCDTFCCSHAEPDPWCLKEDDACGDGEYSGYCYDIDLDYKWSV